MITHISSFDYNFEEDQKIEKKSEKESLVVSVFNSMISEFQKTERTLSLYQENVLSREKELNP